MLTECVRTILRIFAAIRVAVRDQSNSDEEAPVRFVEPNETVFGLNVFPTHFIAHLDSQRRLLEIRLMTILRITVWHGMDSEEDKSGRPVILSRLLKSRGAAFSTNQKTAEFCLG